MYRFLMFLYYQWSSNRWSNKSPTEALHEAECTARRDLWVNPKPHDPVVPEIGEPKAQVQSTLLHKLPLELRQEIFQYAIGNSGIRLIGSYYNYFYSTECVSNDLMCGSSHPGSRDIGFVKRLPLLLTCRQT
jgi:hypothetical protein